MDKKERLKYRSHKAVYERIYGRSISDGTWYRLVAGMKEYFEYRTNARNAELIVKTFAGLKKQCPAFSFKGKDFEQRYKAFKHFYALENRCTLDQFFQELESYLEIDIKKVPRSTKYYWVGRAGLNYSRDEIYSTKDLALAAFAAAQWAINHKSEKLWKENEKIFTEARRQLCPSL